MAAPKGSFQWTNKQVEMLKERYQIDGPTKLSREMNIPYWVLLTKAKRLGIAATRKTPPKGFRWSAKKLIAIKDRYVEEGGDLLAEEFGVALDTVRRKASEMGLHSIAGHARWGQQRAETNTSCNIRYFDAWSPNMAYVLGFLFADGSMSKDMNRIDVNIVCRDEAVLHFIHKELQATGTIKYAKPRCNPKTGTQWEQMAGLVLCSKVLAEQLLCLGLKPRKTYNDDPFPSVPDAMMPDFIRGYLDGDGCICIGEGSHCYLGFVGSVKFITGLRDALTRLTSVPSNAVVLHHGKTATYAYIGWSALRDLRSLNQFIYPEGFGFCLERKRRVLADWLALPHKEITLRRWFTEAELEIIKTHHSRLGVPELSRLLNRSPAVIYRKLEELGLIVTG